MTALKREILQQAVLALATSGGMTAGLLVVSILITRSLGVSGRGEVAAALLLPTTLSFLGQLGLPVATGYWLNAMPAKRRVIIGTARTLAIVLSAAFCLINIVSLSLLSFPEPVYTASVTFTLIIPVNIFAYLQSAILQADLRSVALNLVRLSGVLFYALFVWQIVVFDLESTMTVVLAQLAGATVGLLISCVALQGALELAFDREIARMLVSYGWRAHLGVMQPVDTLRVDQLILALFLSTHALGVYVVAMTFVMANRSIGYAIGLITFPIASKKGDDGSKTSLLLSLSVLALVLAGIASLIEITFGRELLSVLFEVQSDETYTVMTILVFGSVFMVARQVVSDIFRGLGLPLWPTFSELVMMVTLFASTVGLWKYGVRGVSVAVLISSITALLFLLIVGWRLTRDGNKEPPRLWHHPLSVDEP